MPKDTPSMARNKIRRCLAAIVDPHPSAADKVMLWEYFESECAYCGVTLRREDRSGHLDHVLASSAGGSNSIYNHVLSCGRCNGDEKREENWETFLSRKEPNPAVAQARRLRIESWLARSPAVPTTSSREAQAEAIVSEALASFDNAVGRMRALRHGGI